MQPVRRWTAVLGRVSKKCGITLLPSFVRPEKPVERNSTPSAPGSSALLALNGLRGVACLIVFNYHLLFVWTDQVNISWGTHSGDAQQENTKEKTADQIHPYSSLIQLPFVRLLYAGHAMIIIFFVISGYVLSHKPLKLIRATKSPELANTLSSSAFRRGIRLFGPALVATFVTMCLTSAGFFRPGEQINTEDKIYRGVQEQHPEQFDTVYEQLGDWGSSMRRLVGNVWNWDLYYNHYDPHLWTIPLEFQGSIVLYMCLLTFSRLRPAVRVTVSSILVLCCLFVWMRWEVSLFLSGMLLAELDMISGIFRKSPLLDEKDCVQGRRSHAFAWWLVLLLGLYLSSCPSSSPGNAPGYQLLVAYLTDGWTWQAYRPIQALGGYLIVWSFMHLPKVQRLFIRPVAQYFGQISYALYIVHGPILHAVGYRLVRRCWSLTGNETPLGFACGLALAASIILPFAIWLADLFWRAVDDTFVHFARWVDHKLSAKPSGLRDDGS